MSAPAAVGELLSIAEAARMRGCSRRTIERWLASGVLPAVVVAGRRLIRRSDLRRLTPPEGR